mgnify:CR=1 FL=1
MSDYESCDRDSGFEGAFSVLRGMVINELAQSVGYIGEETDFDEEVILGVFESAIKEYRAYHLAKRMDGGFCDGCGAAVDLDGEHIDEEFDVEDTSPNGD